MGIWVRFTQIWKAIVGLCNMEGSVWTLNLFLKDIHQFPFLCLVVYNWKRSSFVRKALDIFIHAFESFMAWDPPSHDSSHQEDLFYFIFLPKLPHSYSLTSTTWCSFVSSPVFFFFHIMKYEKLTKLKKIWYTNLSSIFYIFMFLR